MLLTARLLKDVSDVNHFDYAEVLEFMEGDTPTLYLQLVDGSVGGDLRPAGRRYIPAAGAVLQVTIKSIDNSLTIQRNATQPFPEDRSIFALVLTADDTVQGTKAFKLKLTEGTKVTNGYVEQAISVRPASPEF